MMTILRKILNGIIISVTKDYSKVLFTTSLVGITLSVAIYLFGYSTRNDLQKFMVDLETLRSEHREMSSFLGNANNLFDTLRTKHGTKLSQESKKQATEYINSLKAYLADHPTTGQNGNLLYNEIVHLEKSLANGYLDIGLTPSYASNEIVHTTMSPLVYSEIFNHIKEFASNKTQILEVKVRIWEKDSRNTLIENMSMVSALNKMIDAGLCGGILFYFGIAISLSALGKQRPTGFV